MWNPTKPALPVTSTAPAPSVRNAHDRWTLATSILAGTKVDTAAPGPPTPDAPPTSPAPTPNLTSAYTKSEIAAHAPRDSIGLVSIEANTDATPRALRLRPRMGRTSP